MTDSQSEPRIEVGAARMAVEWKNLFAAELKSVAQHLAMGSDVVTKEHYLQAMPIAVSKVLQAVQEEAIGSANAKRRIA